MGDGQREASVTGVVPVQLFAVSYKDEAGKEGACPMMVVGGLKAYRFIDTALEADTKTPDWMAQGLLKHVKDLTKGAGDEEV